MAKSVYRIPVNEEGHNEIPRSVFDQADLIGSQLSDEQQVLLARLAVIILQIQDAYKLDEELVPDLCGQEIGELAWELDLRFGMHDMLKYFFGTNAWAIRFGGETLNDIELWQKQEENKNA
jgi:hypothetical protein